MPTRAELEEKDLPKNPSPFTHIEAEAPTLRLPPGAINTHCHVNSEGTKEFPYSPATKYIPAPAPWETLSKLDAKLGFSGEVVVAATCHGTDNSYMKDALQKAAGRAMGVAFVKSTISDEELIELDEAGVRGVRYSYVKRLTTPPPPEEMIDMAKRLQLLTQAGKLKNDWHIDLYCEAADLIDLEKHIQAIPIPVVFDHMAVPVLKNGVNDAAFQRFLQILENDGKKNRYAKVTCPERLTGSGDPERWREVLPFAQTLIKTFPGQVLTGTDWPHPNMKPGQMPNDGQLVNYWIAEITGSKPETLKQILVENTLKLFNFDREKIMKPREY